MRVCLTVIALLFACSTAYAGFFDNVVNQAEQATGKIIEDTVDSVINGDKQKADEQAQPVEDSQPTPANQPPPPVNDRQLVRDIQTELNNHGYNAGKPDGLYGPGTRKAIAAYQRDKGLAVDGQPSSALLTSLRQTPKTEVVSKPTPAPAVAEEAKQSDNLPAPVPVSTATPDVFTLPGCDALQPWAASYKRGEMVQVTPRVEVASLLRPDLTTPLFGLPAERWTHDQFSSVYKKMIDCRNEAGKKDKTAFNQFHQAARGVSKGASAMTRVDRFRDRAAKTVDKILDHPASPELPKLVDAAQTALRGEDPSEALAVDPKLAYVAGDVKNLRSYCDYLTDEDRDALIARLEAGKGDVIAASAAIEKELADARKAVAEAPATPGGLQSLQQLSQAPVLDKIGMDEAAAFREEVAQRQREIRAELSRQEAEARAQAQAEAKRPIDLGQRLAQLIRGEDLDELSIGGLALEMPEQQAVSTLERDWKFEYKGGLSINNDFVATKPIFPLLKKERRNGGKVHLGIMDDGTLGQVHYVEYYKAMIVNTTPQAWLTKYLGEPDKVSGANGGRLLTWNQGDLHLQVLATNQIETVWRFADYEGQLTIALWSDDYEEHLADVGKRCDKLLEEKRGKGTMSESIWFGLNCGLAGGAKDHAGL